MNNYTDNDAFDIQKENKKFDYNTLSGLGESNYENEELFNTEVSDSNADLSSFEAFEANTGEDYSNDFVYGNMEVPIDYENLYDTYGFFKDTGLDSNEQKYVHGAQPFEKETMNSEKNEEQDRNVDDYVFVETNDYHKSNDEFSEDVPVSFMPDNLNFDDDIEDNKFEEMVEFDEKQEYDSSKMFDTTEVEKFASPVDEKSYEGSDVTTEVADNLENHLIEETVIQEQTEESTPQNILSDTPIEELNKLTEFTEDKIETIDIKSLFDRVGVNVKEASDIFKKNTEMKEKIDSRFEELKKLQSEVEKVKQNQYDEINAYKEEVLGKLTEKKEQIEERLNKLKEFQVSLEKEKEAFEQYRKKEKEEIERVQKEVQEAYDDRREELNHIEDVLRKQKDALDEERSQLSLDRIQYESDKNELANNLLKFNEIVDAFTNGMDKIRKE